MLTRGEAMFWETAYVIAVLIGMFALVAGSQVRPELNPLLVLLLGVVPGAIVWIARKLWKPRAVARGDDVDATLDRYESSDPVVDEYQSKGPYTWHIFTVAAIMGSIATFVYRGYFEDQDRLAQFSVMPGLVVGGVVVVKWALRRPLVNVKIRPLFSLLGGL